MIPPLGLCLYMLEWVLELIIMCYPPSLINAMLYSLPSAQGVLLARQIVRQHLRFLSMSQWGDKGKGKGGGWHRGGQSYNNYGGKGASWTGG